MVGTTPGQLVMNCIRKQGEEVVWRKSIRSVPLQFLCQFLHTGPSLLEVLP